MFCLLRFGDAAFWWRAGPLDQTPPPPAFKHYFSSVGLVPGESPPKRSRRETLKRMCEALWEPVLSSLSHVLVYCSDPLVVTTAVDGYKAFAVAAGVLGEQSAS